MKKIAALSLTLGIIAACSESIPEDYASFVDPLIGSGGHGHVFVGASVPFGAVQLGPTSIPQEWDWCSGYHESDSTVIGFSHTHLEGTGIGDLFDVTVMPVTGEVTYARGSEDDPDSGLWSYAARSRQIVEPGYYKVDLLRYGITAELTATARTGLHRYTFPENAGSAIVFDLENGGCWDKATMTEIRQESATGISGLRFSKGWADDQRLFFHAEFSRPFDSIELIGPDKEHPLYARMNFSTSEGERILVKVSISPVSIEGAKANMAAEMPGWDFDAVKAEARTAWNRELSKIKIDTADSTAMRIFYTGLYHTMIHPAVFNDTDGNYRGADGKIHGNADFVNYTVFSLWDTYRAAHPLMTIIHPEKVNDIVNTMLHIYEQQGKLPVWHLMGCETNCMIGNPGVITVADALVKGFKGFDAELAYAAMKNTVMLDERGQDLRKQYGFIPCDLYNEGLANDMEYAIADAAVANAAEFLGKKEDGEFFRKRSRSYLNYMDKETLLARGRLSDGSWRTPFNPFASNHREQDYCEGNAWQYTWLAPHDFEGLTEFYGTTENLTARLDTLFAQKTEIEGSNVSPDISGMIGQYAHGNEPSHHILYFYTMAGEPAKTADKVREVYATQYSDRPDGLSGNEDEGQMSAWYVLSSLGFYQVEPAVPRYWFGAPLFDRAVVKVSGGEFVIRAENLSDTDRYIQKVTLDGREYKLPYISYKDIYKGGELVFTMGDSPAKWY